MQCGNCGAAASQGPDGSWICTAQCGWSSSTPSVASTPEITSTRCRRCGSEVHGLDGRYACGLCSWVNPWDEGHTTLPDAEPEDEYVNALH
jgi:ribosomal protein L37E